MIVQNDKEIEQLKEIGRIVAITISEMKKHCKPGITTKELDSIGHRILKQHGARSAPMKMYQFPGATCISINDEAAHGIPGNRVIGPNDVVNIDVSAVKNGFFADAGHSFPINPENDKLKKLCDTTHRIMMKVISEMRAGMPLRKISELTEREAKKSGYKLIHNLCSHGIGRSLHEEPKEIYPTPQPGDHRVLEEGMVITFEPFLSTGADYVLEDFDGWTLKTPDGSLVAQHEHTLIVTRHEPIILTSL